VGPTRARGSFP